MKTLKLPGLIDVHVHMREPGATHKEDWRSGTSAALAGGITTVLTMPNTQPSITNLNALELANKTAENNSFCDWGQFVGAGPNNALEIAKFANQTAGLKMYLDLTFGNLKLDERDLWIKHFEAWPKTLPLAVHAEGSTMEAVIEMANNFDRPIHICHVSKESEILLIRKAKDNGQKVTCEVAPHHLFLTEEDIPKIGLGRSEVKPRLSKQSDVDALWKNLDVIDCFATDHAPHTLEEKDSLNPPPGFPGLETALPLLLTAVNQGRIDIEDIVLRMYTNPRKIFNLPEQKNTYIEVDLNEKWEYRASTGFSKCAWSPYDGWKMQGRVKKIVLRGEEVFINNTVQAKPGFGKNVRK